MTEEDLRSLMFGDYMNPDAEEEDRVYTEVKSLNDMYHVVNTCMEDYNNTHKTQMNLVIFRYYIYSQITCYLFFLFPWFFFFFVHILIPLIFSYVY